MESLPTEVFHEVAARLKPSDLAALALQSQPLRIEVSRPLLWREHCLSWWPHAATAVELNYQGDWHRMFWTRAAMPPSFPAASDKISSITEEAKLQTNAGALCTVFEQILRCLEVIERAIAMKPDLEASSEFAKVRSCMQWWLNEHSQAAIKFARDAVSELHARNWRRQGSLCDAEWKLNGLEALIFLGLDQHAHLSVQRRLRAEINTLRHFLVELTSG